MNVRKLFGVLVCIVLFGHAQAETESVLIKQMERIASGITIPAVKNGDTKIIIPPSPSGYKLELMGTDKLPVVDAAGNIGKPITDQEVTLYFQLTDNASQTKLDVTDKKVWVKGEMSPMTWGNVRPGVIPALQEWVGDEGRLTLKTKGEIVIDPAYEKELTESAALLAADLKEMSGMIYTVKTGEPKKGVLYFTLNTPDKQLGEEGYRLSVGDYVGVEAVANKGAFWATRTLLQMIQQQGLSLVKGTARDYPKYARRGFTIDVARKFFRLNFLQSYIKIMAYYKLNEFHVHLNDNGFPQYFDNDWDKTYAAFRLESETFPGLTAKDGHYTKAEFTALQKQGMLYGVNVIPEIDVPAHSLAFSHYRKSLGSEKYGMDHLDILNPKTYDFLDSLFKEYLAGDEPVFVGPEVHIGTDEYSKEVAEEFRKFTDHYLRYVKSFGKQPRMWGALTHADGKTPVISEGVTMNAWFNGYADPKKMIEQGYGLISTPDGYLYIVPVAGYYYDYLNNEFLYEKWEPVNIGRQTFPFGHPQVLGGSFAVWNDHVGNGISEKDVHHRAFSSLQVLAEKMWDGTRKDGNYETFEQLAASMIEAPGVNIMGRVRVKGDLAVNYMSGNKVEIAGKEQAVKTTGKTSLDKQNGLVLDGFGTAVLPVREIGYDYTVMFDLKPAKDNVKDAVLFQSPNAVVVVNESNSGKLAFLRDGYCYHFDYAPEAGKWTKIAIQGDNRGTALYVNDKLVELLQGKEKIVKNKNGKEDRMYIQQTLVFPLERIGDDQRGFKGELKNLLVYNRKKY